VPTNQLLLKWHHNFLVFLRVVLSLLGWNTNIADLQTVSIRVFIKLRAIQRVLHALDVPENPYPYRPATHSACVVSAKIY